MSEPKFTKGPWSVWTSHHEIADTGDYYDEVGVKDGNGRQICVMCGDWDDGVMEANVALIKTAPEMYELLLDCHREVCKTIRFKMWRYMIYYGRSLEQAIDLLGKTIEYARKIKHVLKKSERRRMKTCIKNKIQYSHANINERFESLTMQPPDWKILDVILDSEEYRELVLEYQEKENKRLPSCNSLFAVCRNFSKGKCTSRTFCPMAQK